MDAGATGGLRQRLRRDAAAGRSKPGPYEAMGGLVVGDEGFDPVGGWKNDGPEMRRRAIEGECNFEALARERFDANYAAAFGVTRLGIGNFDDVTGGERSDRELKRAAVGVDHAGFAFDDPLAMEEMEARDNANAEKNALATAAVGDVGGGALRGVVRGFVTHTLCSVLESSALEDGNGVSCACDSSLKQTFRASTSTWQIHLVHR